MRILPALAVVIFVGASPAVFAQSKDVGIPPTDQNFPNTLQPVNPVKYYGPRKAKKKKKSTVTYDARDEYYDRMEKTWREREKNSKTFDINNGDDQLKPPYFGHKKPPKIRPIGKRKYCKICGIRH